VVPFHLVPGLTCGSLNTRAVQILIERDPSRVYSHLKQLESQTQSVLTEMRKFISEKKPKM
jgi:hypothetical protein